MAFYYVRDHASGIGTADGTDDGRYVSQLMGDWDTAMPAVGGYYSSVNAAMDAPTSPGPGDYVFVSHIHDHDYAGGGDIRYFGATINSGPEVFVISVDDTDITEWLSGAIERSDNNIELDEVIYVYGITLETNGSGAIYFDIFCSAFLELCRFILNSNTSFEVRGLAQVSTKECDLEIHGFSGDIDVLETSSLKYQGGSISSSVSVTRLFSISGASGGIVEMVGVDFTGFDGSFYPGGWDARSDRIHHHRFYKCGFDPGVLINNVFPFRPGIDVLLSNCGETNAQAEYQFLHYSVNGAAEAITNDSIIRDETAEYPSGIKTSLRATTGSEASITRPFGFNLSLRNSNFAVLQTVRVFFAIVDTETLTDSNCWANVLFPDGTNPRIYNRVSNKRSDFWNTGTEHQTDVDSTWLDNGMGLVGYKEYFMDIDLSGNNPGNNGVIEVQIELAIPDVVVYFDPIVELV